MHGHEPDNRDAESPYVNETASRYYQAMLKNGRVPERVSGGPFDGLLHFKIDLDGKTYWITQSGMLDPELVDRFG